MTRLAFDPETIARLAAILDGSGLTEIELRDGDAHLRLRRDAPTYAAAPIAAPAPAAAPPPAAAAPADETPPAGAVTSPMVGVAYLAPEPGAAPFVTVGAQVSAGQTLLLIEAMKTFNQIKATEPGIVRQVLVTSGQPVEYGQPLVVIG